MRNQWFNKLEFPIIQGGMGVGISLGNLAGHVMKAGCMGVISAAHPGYKRADFRQDSVKANCMAIHDEVNKARTLSQGKGLLGMNIMCASRDYAHYVKASIEAGVDAIISGAGLPLDLPKLAEKTSVLLAPIVSSAKAAQLICKAWFKRYQRIPDFMVIEGSLAGGHLGFKKQDLLDNTCQPLEDILQEVKAVIAPFEKEMKQTIPLFVAGGIIAGQDIAKYLKAGASGVQMGTRFIATEECDADPFFKRQILACRPEDIRIVHSPSGFPGRALANQFFRNNPEDKRISMKKCLLCLTPCTPENTPYCISEALIQSVKGNVDHGVVFVGARAGEVSDCLSVADLIQRLRYETNLAMEGLL